MFSCPAFAKPLEDDPYLDFSGREEPQEKKKRNKTKERKSKGSLMYRKSVSVPKTGKRPEISQFFF